MFTVYVLFSPNFNKHYTGFSSDFDKRFVSHNILGIKGWTKAFRPWTVIYTKDFSNKNEAMTYEKWLKTGAGRKFILSLPH
jgi:putative endonuclease